MGRYGIDYYGKGYYGPEPYIVYSAAPFVAKSVGYGKILLTWKNPVGKWSKVKLLRNSYGFPVDPSDGQSLLTTDTLSYQYKKQAKESYLDTVSNSQVGYYYYSLFVYQTSVAPYSWIRVGTTIGLSVNNYGNADTLYNYLPDIYKITYPYVATSDKWDNQDLKDFLNLFGFEFDRNQTIVDLLNRRYNPLKVYGPLVPVILKQFGLTYEPELGIQQARKLMRDASELLRTKGSKIGFLDFVKDYTGYGVPIPTGQEPNPSVNGLITGHNIMLSYNDSSFEESNGQWVSPDSSATLSNPLVKDIKFLSLTSNVAELTIGEHNYKPYNYVLIKNTAFPLFNSPSIPVQITAVTPTTIQFALTGDDVPLSNGWNLSIPGYGQVVPAPFPYLEPNTPPLFPNKQNGIMAVTNASTSSGTLNLSCGEDDPIQNGIPVTAGLGYSFSIYAAKESGTKRYVTAKIKWYDRFGVYISTSSGTQTYNDTNIFSDSYRPYVTDTAPTGAQYAVPALSIDSAAGSGSHEWYYFDCAQFEQSSSVTEFDEARQLHLTLKATRINELINPSFVEVSPGSISPWSITGAASHAPDITLPDPTLDVMNIISVGVSTNVATVTTQYPHPFAVGDVVYLTNVTGTGVTSSKYNGARTITMVSESSFSYNVTTADETTALVDTGVVYEQANVLQITSSGSTVTVSSGTGSSLMDIYYPETDYTFSVYARAGSSVESVTPKINWYDSTKTLISTSTGAAKAITNAEWERPSVTGTAPVNTAYAEVQLVWASTTAGTTIEIDNSLFENTSYVVEYFDGNHGPENYTSLSWEGNVPNQSRSHFYKNQLAVEKRIASGLLNDYLTLGSTVAIYLVQPRT